MNQHQVAGKGRCGVCGQDLSGNASVCSVCGTSLVAELRSKDGARPVLALVVGTAAFALVAGPVLMRKPVRPPPSAVASPPARPQKAGSPRKAPSVDEFLAESKGAEWETKVFFLKSLVQSKNPRALDYLIPSLKADREIGNVRMAAAQAIGEGGWKEAIPELIQRLEIERVSAVSADIALALHRLGDPRGDEALIRWIGEAQLGEHGTGDLRTQRSAAAARAAGQLGLVAAKVPLERLMTSADGWVAQAGVDGYAQVFGKDGLPALKAVLRPHHEGVNKQFESRCWAIHAAAQAIVKLDPENGRTIVKEAMAGCPSALR